MPSNHTLLAWLQGNRVFLFNQAAYSLLLFIRLLFLELKFFFIPLRYLTLVRVRCCHCIFRVLICFSLPNSTCGAFSIWNVQREEHTSLKASPYLLEGLWIRSLVRTVATGELSLATVDLVVVAEVLLLGGIAKEYSIIQLKYIEIIWGGGGGSTFKLNESNMFDWPATWIDFWKAKKLFAAHSKLPPY